MVEKASSTLYNEVTKEIELLKKTGYRSAWRYCGGVENNQQIKGFRVGSP